MQEIIRCDRYRAMVFLFPIAYFHNHIGMSQQTFPTNDVPIFKQHLRFFQRLKGREHYLILLGTDFLHKDRPIQMNPQATPLSDGIKRIAFVPSYKIPLFIDKSSTADLR